jgi:plasmid stability protein
MASITIRNLDARTIARLRSRAAHHKHSVADEARSILRAALAMDASNPQNLADAIRRRFESLGGVWLRLPVRQPMRDPLRSGSRTKAQRMRP